MDVVWSYSLVIEFGTYKLLFERVATKPVALLRVNKQNPAINKYGCFYTETRTVAGYTTIGCSTISPSNADYRRGYGERDMQVDFCRNKANSAFPARFV